MALLDKLSDVPGYTQPQSHHGNRDHEFIAWDGEGIQTEEVTPINFGTDSKPIYSPFEMKPKDPWEHPEVRHARSIIDEEFTDYRPQPQPYVLLANSKGDRIIDPNGLGTEACFELMLETKKKYPNSIHVGFGTNYDVNQMLKDVPVPRLRQLHKSNVVYWKQYRIEWLPGKWLQLSSGSTKRQNFRGFRIYDVLGFFQTSFLEAARKYLGKDDPDLQLIERGKAARNAFTIDELDDFIIPYNDMELSMLVRMMNILRDDFASIGVYPGYWHGPGAAANRVLAANRVPVTRMLNNIKNEVLDASQYAYAGGRFEHILLGRTTNTVYEYDINSAYPAGATHLPDLSKGVWEYVERFEPEEFGVWHIDYRSRNRAESYRPEPFFCRSQDGFISYPREVEGWYWTPEAKLCPDSVQEGWIFRPLTDERPFTFIEAMYDERRVFKLSENPAERALKLILNSIYGKLAQTVGGKNGPPGWHQFESAGYITSYTRAKIYEAVMLNPDSIIAIETDAVFSTEPLDLPLTNKLGDWEQKTYSEITYLQSGYYYAVNSDGSVVCKYRGMDRDRETKQPVGLPYRTVLDHLRDRTGKWNQRTPPLFSYSTRYVGLGLALKTSATWRSWEKSHKQISLDSRSGKSKRTHVGVECGACQFLTSMYDMMHPMQISGYSGHSYARNLPWRQHPDRLTPEMLKLIDENFGNEIFRWEMI